MGDVTNAFVNHKAHALVLGKYNRVVDALHEWRNETFKLAAAIVRDAEAEGRALTPDEIARLDDLHAELLLVCNVNGAMRVDPVKLGVVGVIP